MGSVDDVFKWPDGFWCYRDELEGAIANGQRTIGESSGVKVLFEGTQEHTDFVASN